MRARARARPFICIAASCFVLKVLITSIIKVDTVRSFVPIQASAFHLLAAYSSFFSFFFLFLAATPFSLVALCARALPRSLACLPGPGYLL